MSDSTVTVSNEESVQARRWMAAWKTAGPILERLRREDIRNLDTYEAISNLTGPIDFTREPYCAQPTSGLIQQQEWFKKFRR
jgi:hypothetical protein